MVLLRIGMQHTHGVYSSAEPADEKEHACTHLPPKADGFGAPLLPGRHRQAAPDYRPGLSWPSPYRPIQLLVSLQLANEHTQSERLMEMP